MLNNKEIKATLLEAMGKRQTVQEEIERLQREKSNIEIDFVSFCMENQLGQYFTINWNRVRRDLSNM